MLGRWVGKTGGESLLPVQLRPQKLKFNATCRLEGMHASLQGGVYRREQTTNSALLHHARGTSKLALDLLASPPRRLNSPGLEFAVGPSLLDQCSNPILTEGFNKFSVRIGIGKITKYWLVTSTSEMPDKVFKIRRSYPITPIEALIKASLRFASPAMLLSSSKIDCTYGWRTWAAGNGQKLWCEVDHGSRDSLLELAFMAPIMPPQASIMPSRKETT